jgi:hypothetical protein
LSLPSIAVINHTNRCGYAHLGTHVLFLDLVLVKDFDGNTFIGLGVDGKFDLFNGESERHGSCAIRSHY